MATPTEPNSSRVNSGVAPNSVMFASTGTFTASTNFWYVGKSYAASAKMPSAPASTQAMARSMAASTPSA